MRRLLSPAWVITHVLVVAIAVTFVALGLWQVRRHGEQAAENVRITAMADADPQPVEDLLAAATATGDPTDTDADIDLRPVVAEGRWVADAEVALSPRSRNGRPGFHALTPLQLADGRALLVDRGWVPLDDEAPPPPEGEVQIEGRLRSASEARQVLRAEDGTVTSVSAVDPQVLQGQVEDLVPTAWVEVVDEAARQAGTVPRPAEPLDPEPGPHLSYAFQWFAFAAIGLIGYPLLLRRRIREGTTPAGPHGPADHVEPQLKSR